MTNNLFEFEEDTKALPEWKTEWRNMPEFYQADNRPYHQIRVKFTCNEDVERFAQLINQKITPKTVSVRYPERVIVKTSHLHWVSKDK